MSAGTGGARQTRRSLAGLAAGGVMAGHWLAYAVREPDAGARAILLEATGHHLLPQLSLVAAIAAAAALIAVPLRARQAGPVRYGRLARRLVGLQLAGFATLELGERLLAHGGHLELAHLADPALLVGLAAQVLIGLAAAGIAVGLARVASRARLASLSLPEAPRRSRPASATPALSRPGRDACSLRGPPLLSRA